MDNDWGTWSKHVLLELERLNKVVEEFKKDNFEEHGAIRNIVNLTHTEIAILKVKSGLWGAAAGAVPTIIALIWYLMTKP